MKVKKESRGGYRPGSGAKKKADKLDATVTFRIKEAWREPVKVAVRAVVKKLKAKD